MWIFMKGCNSSPQFHKTLSDVARAYLAIAKIDYYIKVSPKTATLVIGDKYFATSIRFGNRNNATEKLLEEYIKDLARDPKWRNIWHLSRNNP